MTRDLPKSKSAAIHDHHVTKHGHADHQDKKNGAGKGNWGTVDDAKADVIDTFAESDSSTSTASKV